MVHTTDNLQCFIFNNTCIRGKIIHLDQTLKTIRKLFLSIRTIRGEQEALAILKTHRFIEVTYEYCNNHFEFNEDEIRRLFRLH